MSNEPVFEIRGITKKYPGVIANEDVSFTIDKGSIHALLGENGAGKSTLVKIMYGLVAPSAGEMRFEGAPYHPHKPQEARALGIGMVFQHFSLFDALSVAENIALGLSGGVASQKLKKQIAEVSTQYGLSLDADAIVGDLSAGERQRVEIVRALLQNPKLLIMDEPTSVLTPGEVEILFETLRKLKAQNLSILYISHKLEEIRALCDEATVLRRGRVVASCDPREQSARELAEMMVGSTLPKPKPRQSAPGEVQFSIKNASTQSDHLFGTNLQDISFDIRSHEILGIAGVAGNGQDELMELISGELPMRQGQMQLGLDDLTKTSTKKRRKLGLISAPEERLGHAAVPVMSLAQNALLTGETRRNLSRNGWLSWGRISDFANEIVKVFDVRTPGIDVAANSLSGGNLQKFVIGREILQNPDVFVVNQPSWGVDAAAAEFIRQSIRDLADQGAAVMVISQDLDEIFELADTVRVLAGGKLSQPYPAASVDVQTIGQLMGGAA